MAYGFNEDKTKFPLDWRTIRTGIKMDIGANPQTTQVSCTVGDYSEYHFNARMALTSSTPDYACPTVMSGMVVPVQIVGATSATPSVQFYFPIYVDADDSIHWVRLVTAVLQNGKHVFTFHQDNTTQYGGSGKQFIFDFYGK